MADPSHSPSGVLCRRGYCLAIRSLPTGKSGGTRLHHGQRPIMRTASKAVQGAPMVLVLLLAPHLELEEVLEAVKTPLTAR